MLLSSSFINSWASSCAQSMNKLQMVAKLSIFYKLIVWGAKWKDRLGRSCAWHWCRAIGTSPPPICFYRFVTFCIFSLRSNRWSAAGGTGTAPMNFYVNAVIHVAGIAYIWDAFFCHRTLLARSPNERRLRNDWLRPRQGGRMGGSEFLPGWVWQLWFPYIFLDCLADGRFYL